MNSSDHSVGGAKPPLPGNRTSPGYLPYGLIIDLLMGFNTLTMAPSLCFLACILAAILGSGLRDNFRHVLFANLLLSDTLFLVMTDVVALLVWCKVPVPVASCFAFTIAASALNYTGLLCVTLMSLERYVAVCHPLHYHRWLTRRVTAASLAVIWAGCLATPLGRGVLVLAGGGPLPVNQTTCAGDQIDGLLANASAVVALRESANAAVFAASSLAVAFSYANVVRAARRAAASEADGGADGAAAAAGASRARGTLALHAVQLTLYICSLGNSAVLAAMGPLLGEGLASRALRWGLYVILFVLSRLAAPFAYGVRDKQIVRQLKRMMRHCGAGKVSPADVG